MDAIVLLATLVVVLIGCLGFLTSRKNTHLPPGSFGIPIIGQSISFHRAMMANKAEDWIRDRVEKYGPISKVSLFGTPTVIITGQAGNKLIFANSNSNLIGHQTPKSLKRIIGEKNMFEAAREDHRQLRHGVLYFLKPDMLKKYVRAVDGEVQQHMKENWEGRNKVVVFPLIQKLTFDIICSILFGIDDRTNRLQLLLDLSAMIEGGWAVPINLPYTRFNESLHASRRVHAALFEFVRQKKKGLDEGTCSPDDNLITYLLSIESKDGKRLSEEEIVHNSAFIMVAGFDTSSILISFVLRHLAKDQTTCECILKEQEEIAKKKGEGEALAWEDLAQMKYTWRVALEQLRLVPPLFGNFRRVLQDFQFGGYHIPKGWQVFWATFVTHMDPNIFPEPTKFDPSRFENPSSIPPYTFLGFGAGARSCPGNEFARIETLVALHYMVRSFKWSLGCDDDGFKRFPMPAPNHGLPLDIQPRNTN